MSTILLCASANQASFAVWRLGRLDATQTFPSTDAGHRAARAWLAPYRGRTARVTADTPEEDYRLESVPHVPVRQRGEMFERKLQQSYRESRFRAARVVRSVRGKRREHLCLFAALTDEAVLAPWLDILQGAGLVLTGIFPVPLLLADLAARLRPKAKDVLLVTRWAEGMRQTYISETLPLLTRVTALRYDPGVHDPGTHDPALDELRRTYEYLESLGLAHPGTPLHVLVLDPALRMEAGQAAAALAIECVAATELARCIGRPPPSADPGSALQLMLLARHRGAFNLAPAALRAPHRRRRMTLGMTALGLCTCAVCLAAAATQAGEALRASRGRSALEAQDRGVAHVAPPAQDAAPVLSAELDAYLRKLEEEGGTLEPARLAYQNVSRALEAHPQLVLLSLRWERRRAQANGEGAAAGVTATARLQLRTGGRDRHHSLLVMQGFAAQLARQPEVETATLSALPEGFAAASSLRGEFASSVAPSDTLEFETTVQFAARHAPH